MVGGSQLGGDVATISLGLHNGRMAASLWQRRIQRAEELITQHEFAAEILGFYIHVARFQEETHRRLSRVLQSAGAYFDRELTAAELEELLPRFDSFLSLAESRGPQHLGQFSRQLKSNGETTWRDLLNNAWLGHSASDSGQLLAVALLQPYAELLRSRAAHHSTQNQATQQNYAICPVCRRKPGFGVFRQMGEGAARSLVCGFCLGEWGFRRIVCPGCGEENERKLAIFSADEFNHIRVEGCDTCKTYIKSVDLTRNGHAEPLVDELVSAPLDLWAAEHGYAKLKKNILGM
jgi:formate dehydrogenase maturation protein FdhE